MRGAGPAAGDRLEFERSGGFGGLVLRASLRSDQLSAEEIRNLRELAAAQRGEPPPVPPGPDRFQYDLRLVEGGAEHRVRCHEGGVPEPILPLIRRLSQAAMPDPG